MAEQRTLDAERAEFEAWALKCGFKPTTFSHRVGASYLNQYLEDYWTCWQAARRAPPALDAEGLPPLIWGDDLEAWLEVRDEAEIVAAIRAAQRHAYDAGQKSQAARIQHLTHERDLALAAARQSAPEGAPVCQAGTGDGQWLDIRPEDAETWRKIYYTVRTLYAPTSASAQPVEGSHDQRAELPPLTPEEIVAFIGNHYNVMHDAENGDVESIKYELTVHDIQSAFRWWYEDYADQVAAHFACFDQQPAQPADQNKMEKNDE